MIFENVQFLNEAHTIDQYEFNDFKEFVESMESDFLRIGKELGERSTTTSFNGDTIKRFNIPKSYGLKRASGTIYSSRIMSKDNHSYDNFSDYVYSKYRPLLIKYRFVTKENTNERVYCVNNNYSYLNFHIFKGQTSCSIKLRYGSVQIKKD